MAYQRGVFWGVVPFTPAAPFTVKFVRNWEEYATVSDLSRAIREQDVAGDFPFEVRGKMRPVLALTEPSTELREITALRLANITRRVRDRLLTREEEQSIRSGEHPYLFPLDNAAVRNLGSTPTYDLYAVNVDSPVTLHQSAVATRPVGEVSEATFAAICERYIEALGLPRPAPEA